MSTMAEIREILNGEFSVEISTLFIEITNFCNLRCKHCYNNSSSEGKKVLSYDQIIKAVDKIRNYQIKTIILSGGEALLHTDIWDIVKYLKSRDMKVLLLSNGTTLNQEIIEKLKKFDVHLQISLDGANAASNDIVRGKGSFEKIIKALDLIYKLEYNNKTSINVVVNKNNYKELNEIYEKIMHYKIDELGFNLLQQQGRAKDNDYYLDAHEMNLVYSEITKLYKRNTIVKKEIGTSLTCRFCNPKNKTFLLNPVLTYEGDLYPCELLRVKEYAMGNIYDDDINSIICGEKFKKVLAFFRMKESFMKKCKQCNLNKWCKGGCPALSIGDTNNIFENEHLCNTYKNYVKYKMLGVKNE